MGSIRVGFARAMANEQGAKCGRSGHRQSNIRGDILPVCSPDRVHRQMCGARVYSRDANNGAHNCDGRET